MCLGVPGRILEWTVHDELFGKAIVEFAGVRRECQMACVPDAAPGDYVIVHAGMALCRVNADEAQRTIRELAALASPEDQVTPPPTRPGPPGDD